MLKGKGFSKKGLIAKNVPQKNSEKDNRRSVRNGGEGLLGKEHPLKLKKVSKEKKRKKCKGL